jgi:hypothetical protein
MIYTIKILKKEIDRHYAEIFRLLTTETEMLCDEVFAKQEILERRNYIYQLQQAISLLTKSNN